MSKIKRHIVFGSDDEKEVWEKLNELRSESEKNATELTMARVIHMLNPPITKHKFVIIRVTQD